MDQREWNFRFSAKSAVIGFALGVATIVIASLSGQPEPKLEALSGLLVGLMGTILSMQILQNRELGNLEKIARDAMDLSTRAAKGGAINTTLSQKLNRVHQLPKVVQNIALCGLEAAIDGIDVETDDHAAHIEGRRLALKCYARFWDYIVELQGRSDRPWIARVTHSSEINIFYDKEARKLKSLLRFSPDAATSFACSSTAGARPLKEFKNTLRLFEICTKSTVCI